MMDVYIMRYAYHYLSIFVEWLGGGNGIRPFAHKILSTLHKNSAIVVKGTREEN